MKTLVHEKVKLLFYLLLSVIFYIHGYAQSYSLSTVPPYSSNNGSSTITFNLQAGSSSITVTSLACAFSAASSADIWYSTTPISGTPSVSSPGWTMVGTSTGWTASTLPTPTPLPLALNITIPAGQTYGFCINSTGSLQYLTGTVTPTQITDGRITIINDANVGFGGVMNSGWIANRQFCGTVNYQIATGGTIASPPTANYYYNLLTDTVWINSPYIFVNTSSNASRAYWDITGYSTTSNGNYAALLPAPTRVCVARWNNTCYIDTSDYNFTYSFTKRGFYSVKLKVQNIYTAVINGTPRSVEGVDSITKIIYVDSPVVPPKANFFSVKRTAGFQDQVYFYDLSLNGPTSWQWWLNPNVNNSGAFFLGSPFSINQWFPNTSSVYPVIGTGSNPRLTCLNSGIFDVCEKVFNSYGSDSICKPGYLSVFSGYMMCNGSDSISYLPVGYVYDLFGPVGNYTTASGSCTKGFRISACADSVYLDIEQFRLALNDSLTIRQGGAAGPIIKRLGGSNLPASLKHYGIAGGEVFFQFSMISTTGDSGWAIKWTTKPASYSKPKASFNCPSTIYAGYTMYYQNTSSGINMGYSWDTDGDGNFGLSSSGLGIVDSTSMNPSHLFALPGNYKVCVVAYNCIGYDTACKNITVLSMVTSPVVDFTVNKTNGIMNIDTFKFSDMSLNGPTQWTWTFNPSNYVTFVGGTNANSQNPMVIFSKATCFQVTLTATNRFGSNTKVSSVCMVNVVTYSWPNTSNALPLGSDFGISRVTLESIDTTTPLQSPIYTQMYLPPNLKQATLYRGVNYTVTTYRITNNDPMSTKVWIDYNQNAIFTDAGETIINEARKYKLSTSQTFKIPDNCPTGTSRMRVGVSYDSTMLTPDAAQLGCFEDYSIFVATDIIPPVLTLRGPAVQKVEVNTTFIDSMATAIDNLEGDISSRVVRTGFVDLTKVGYYNLTYTATDLYGNTSAPIVRVVQVEVDRNGPAITLNGKDTITVQVKTNYVEQGATAIDNTGKNISSLLNITGTVNTSILSNYVITYSVTDAFGITSSKIRVVQVVDNTPPQIFSIRMVPITDTVKFQVNTPYVDQIIITDNYWNNITPLRTGTIYTDKIGFYTLIYNATDSSGNQAVPYRLVVHIDNTIAPTMSLNGESPLTVDVNTQWYDPGVTATSPYYTNVLITTTPKYGPDMSKLGITNLVYTACDASQNCTSITRIVNVFDRISPTIDINGPNPYEQPQYYPYTDQGAYLKDNFYTNEQLQPFLKTDNKVNTNFPGLYYVTYNICDPSGNCSTAQRLVKVGISIGINGVSVNTPILVYPNPNNGKFRIDVDPNTEVEHVKIYNLLGELITTVNMNNSDHSVSIDLPSINSGIYFVRVEGNGSTFTQKMTITK